jgi:hypothetical protein
VAGPVKGLAFKSKFGASVFTIGRIVKVDFTVRDESVSSRHAEARWDARKRAWTLVDVGSSNGTRFKGEGEGTKEETLAEGKPRVLKVGDRIFLGPETEVVVSAVGEAEEAEAAEAAAAAGAAASVGTAVAAAPGGKRGGRRGGVAVAAAAAAAAAAPATTAAAGGKEAPPAAAAADDGHQDADDARAQRDMEDELRAYAEAAKARVRAAAARAADELRAEWAQRRAALLALATEVATNGGGGGGVGAS